MNNFFKKNISVIIAFIPLIILQIVNILLYYFVIKKFNSSIVTEFSLALTFSTTFSSFAYFGINNIFIRDKSAKPDITKNKVYFESTLLMSFFSCVIFNLILFFIYKNYSFIFLLMTVISFLIIQLNLIISELRFNSKDFSMVLPYLYVFLLLTISFGYLYFIEIELESILGIIVLFYFILNLVGFWYAGYEFRGFSFIKIFDFLKKNFKILAMITTSSLLLNLSTYLDKYILEFSNIFDISYFLSFRHASLINFLVFMPLTIYWTKHKFAFNDYVLKISNFLKVSIILFFSGMIIGLFLYYIFFEINFYDSKFHMHWANLVFFFFFFFFQFLNTILDFPFYQFENQYYFIKSSLLQAISFLFFSFMYFKYGGVIEYYGVIMLVTSLLPIMFMLFVIVKRKNEIFLHINKSLE